MNSGRTNKRIFYPASQLEKLREATSEIQEARPMRPLEILLTVALLPYTIHLLSLSRGESLVFDVLPFIAALLVICHLVTEGYRWQMLPAYCLTAIFVAHELARWFFDFRASYHAAYYAGLAALIFEFATIGLTTALPNCQTSNADRTLCNCNRYSTPCR